MSQLSVTGTANEAHRLRCQRAPLSLSLFAMREGGTVPEDESHLADTLEQVHHYDLMVTHKDADGQGSHEAVYEVENIIDLPYALLIAELVSGRIGAPVEFEGAFPDDY